MGVTVKDFIGVWRINWATGPGNIMETEEGSMWIGTGSDWGDTPPELTEEYQTCVGFALVVNGRLAHLTNERGGEQPVSTGHHEGHQPLLLMYDSGQLRWTGYYDQKPLRIFISAAEQWQPGGERFISLYGNTVLGDPEQVGVWGGTGTPPPPPDPKKPGRPRKGS